MRTVGRSAALCSLALAMFATLCAAPTEARYTRAGPYLGLARSPSITKDPAVYMLHGLPMNIYANGAHRTPVTIGLYGLQEYSYFITGQGRRHRKRALIAARWFLNQQRPKTGAWLYRFDLYHGPTDLIMNAPWISGMGQGRGMSLLYRAWRLTRDRRYLVAARRAVGPLRRNVRRGGVRRTLAGGPFFEEYPTQPATYTLNGNIFTLFGLYDISRKSKVARRLYHRGLGTLRRSLRLYDRPPLSAYDLSHVTMRRGKEPHMKLAYHRMHVTLLSYLADLEADPFLRRYSWRWRARLRAASD